MKNFPLISLMILPLVISCGNQDLSLIKDNLNSRFTKFEIVETKKDSSNVDDAFNSLLSLKVYASQCNLDIAKAINKFYGINGKWTKKNVINYVDSVSDMMIKAYKRFENLRFSKKEQCYYVKYRIYDGAIKIEKEEYFYIREYGNNQKEILHRPYDWDDYLRQERYSDLVNDGLKYTEEYYEVKNDMTEENKNQELERIAKENREFKEFKFVTALLLSDAKIRNYPDPEAKIVGYLQANTIVKLFSYGNLYWLLEGKDSKNVTLTGYAHDQYINYNEAINKAMPILLKKRDFDTAIINRKNRINKYIRR